MSVHLPRAGLPAPEVPGARPAPFAFCAHGVPPVDSCLGHFGSGLCLCPSCPLQYGLLFTPSYRESVLPGFGPFSGLFILMWVLSGCVHGTR